MMSIQNYEAELVVWYKSISTWAKLAVGFALGFLTCGVLGIVF